MEICVQMEFDREKKLLFIVLLLVYVYYGRCVLNPPATLEVIDVILIV